MTVRVDGAGDCDKMTTGAVAFAASSVGDVFGDESCTIEDDTSSGVEVAGAEVFGGVGTMGNGLSDCTGTLSERADTVEDATAGCVSFSGDETDGVASFASSPDL